MKIRDMTLVEIEGAEVEELLEEIGTLLLYEEKLVRELAKRIKER